MTSLLATIALVASLAQDTDGDTVPDACDNCPSDSNGGQSDADEDGTGDDCDVCPDDIENDWDGDGLCADVDPCPLDPTSIIDGDGACFNVNGLFTDDFELGSTAAWSAAVP